MNAESLATLALTLDQDIYLFEEDRPHILAKALESEPATLPLDPLSEEPKKPLDDPKAAVEKLPEPEPIVPQGGFEKGILILHEEATLEGELMELLSNIIRAVSLSMLDVGFVPDSQLKGRSLEDFHAINAHKVIKFGRITHPINALPIPNYQVTTEGETEFLFADSLTQISQNKALKGKLWKALQHLFTLS